MNVHARATDAVNSREHAPAVPCNNMDTFLTASLGSFHEVRRPKRKGTAMGWGTGKGGGGGDGKHSGGKDPGTAKPSSDTARPAPEPKHKGK